MAAKFSTSQDNKGEWRWKFVASNGKTIAVSSEGYRDKTDLLHAIDIVKNETTEAPVSAGAGPATPGRS